MNLNHSKIFVLSIIAIVLISCKKKDGELLADFTVNYRKINAGEKIKFTDKSRNGPLFWNWIFNGGTPMLSEEQNPEVTYLNPGLYSVSLTVTNDAGNNSLVKSDYIEVLEFACGNDVVDNRDSKLYNTVSIGNYCWFKQNLNVGVFISSLSLTSDNNIIEKMCYNNDEANCNIFGALYRWEEMMKYSNYAYAAICPSGFFIPSKDVFTNLINAAGGDTIAGGILKQQNNMFWDAPNAGATDALGYTALPGGYLENNVFMNLGRNALFWTSTSFDTAYAFSKMLYYDNTIITDSILTKNISASVRCVRNL